MQCVTHIPYVDIVKQHKEIKTKLLTAVSSVLDEGKFVLGEEVKQFEERFATLCQTKFAVGVHSGTDAIILALRALKIGAGDEVITAPNGFISTAAAITLVGARPVFVDVGNDYNIDPALIEAAITKKTKAIIPVHLTGRPAAMDKIVKLARKNKLFVIEDAAQAVTASLEGQKVGSWGDVGCFSLHPLKTLNACGDGGVLTTNDQKLYEELLVLRNNGFLNRDECVIFSNNSRLDTIQAAMLMVKLDHLQTWTEARRKNADLYRKLLADIKQVNCPQDRKNEYSVYHTFVIQADNRDGLRTYLEEHGVGTKIHYPIPMHLQKAARQLGYKKGSFPVTEGQAQKILSLPVYSGLDEEQIKYIVNCIVEFYKGKRSS